MVEMKPLLIFLTLFLMFGVATPFLISGFVDIEEVEPTGMIASMVNFIDDGICIDFIGKHCLNVFSLGSSTEINYTIINVSNEEIEEFQNLYNTEEFCEDNGFIWFSPWWYWGGYCTRTEWEPTETEKPNNLIQDYLINNLIAMGLIPNIILVPILLIMISSLIWVIITIVRG